MTTRRALLGLLRVAVGASILLYLVTRSDGALDVVVRQDLSVVLFATGAHLVALIVGAFRWRAYLGALEAPLGARAVAGLASGGAFFNAFLPTGVGGDAFKAVRVVRAGYERTAAFGSVLLDRLSGLVGLAALGAAASIVLLVSGTRSAVPFVTLLLAVAILAAEMGLAVAGNLLARLAPAKLRPHVREATADMRAASRHPAQLWRGYGLGVLAQAVVVGAHVILAAGLGLRISVATVACAVALAQVAALVPLTVNGAGFREGTYVWVLASVGVSHTNAVAFGLANLGAMLLASLIAGAIYLIGGARIAPRSLG